MIVFSAPSAEAEKYHTFVFALTWRLKHDLLETFRGVCELCRMCSSS